MDFNKLLFLTTPHLQFTDAYRVFNTDSGRSIYIATCGTVSLVLVLDSPWIAIFALDEIPLPAIICIMTYNNKCCVEI